jgi:hypothetical protein
MQQLLEVPLTDRAVDDASALEAGGRETHRPPPAGKADRPPTGKVRARICPSRRRKGGSKQQVTRTPAPPSAAASAPCLTDLYQPEATAPTAEPAGDDVCAGSTSPRRDKGKPKRQPRPKPTDLHPPPAANSAGPAPKPTWPKPIAGVPETFVLLRADGPLCPPDWRWQLANMLVTYPLLPSRYADAGVIMATRYLRRNERAPDAEASAEAEPDWRHLEGALRIYQAEDLHRWEVEARFLAREDTPAIAAKCGYDPAVIDDYHDVFFDVRSKLDHESWIRWRAIGGDPAYIEEGDRPRLLKLFAYAGGPFVLGELLWYFRTPPRVIPLDLQEFSVEEMEELTRWARVRKLVVSLGMKIETFADWRCLMYLRMHPQHREWQGRSTCSSYRGQRS